MFQMTTHVRGLIKMDRYYTGKEEVLCRELDSWLNTPYRHCCGIKKVGVDCIHFVVRVLEATGGVQGKEIVIKPYDRDWGLHHGEELLRKGIERQLYVETISKKEPKKNIELLEPLGPGDIILFQFGRHACHAGIHLNGKVYQTVNETGVIFKPWKGDFFSRATYVYKLYRAVTS
jgi:cell wall-associated NlpC family hydrolase